MAHNVVSVCTDFYVFLESEMLTPLPTDIQPGIIFDTEIRKLYLKVIDWE